jgi:hypothetical protein
MGHVLSGKRLPAGRIAKGVPKKSRAATAVSVGGAVTGFPVA